MEIPYCQTRCECDAFAAKMNIPAPLLPLYDDGFILSVTRPLMGGKEASVFLVETRDGACVAKVYKDAKNRSARQRADYTEGRIVRNTRRQGQWLRAVNTARRFSRPSGNGRVSALYRLHAAGVRVPTPATATMSFSWR